MNCSVKDCAKPIVAKDLCDMHRKRLARHGHLEDTRPENWGQAEKHPLYKLWCGMRRRCSDEKCKSYMDYGARGITVCARWLDFWFFVEDVGERPTRKHQLDRRDNNKGYKPGNVRWATPSEQARNRRDTVLSKETATEIRRRYKYGDRMCDISKALNVAYHNVENLIRKPKSWV